MTHEQYIEAIVNTANSAIEKGEQLRAEGGYRFTIPVMFMSRRGGHDIATLVHSKTNRKIYKESISIHSITFRLY